MAELEYGGTSNSGRRKVARPIDPKRPLYVILTTAKAGGKTSLGAAPNRARVDSMVRTKAREAGVRVFSYANEGSELHLLVQAKRPALQTFLRVLPGGIAMTVTGARKGKPHGHFWKGVAYSRVIDWGDEFEALRKKIRRGRSS